MKLCLAIMCDHTLVPKEHCSLNSSFCLFFCQFLRLLNTTYCYFSRQCVYYFITALTTSMIHINMFIQHHLQVKSDICEDQMSKKNYFVDTSVY